ncbi:hypothetical protein ACEN33_00750 [Ruoffia sp. FAM 24228]|uniref:hypothetical protein n=1 Tax=Ruoffia sp. FAM 24228 TaxID=3259517 RepID=UPI00388739B7
MAQAVGTMYEIVNVPMRLYYDSDRANARNTLQSGWVNEAGSYKIINHVVGTNNVDLYAINDITNSYAIGWIRDDDNIQGVRLYDVPSQISTNDSSYKVGLQGTKGIAYKYTAKIGTTVIHETETTLTYPNTAKTFTLTSTIKNLIYRALGNNNTGVMNISVVSTHNGKTIRTSTSSITVVIPASNGPKFTTNPTVTIVGAIGGSAYKDISSVKVSAPTSIISLKDNATIKSRRFQIGSHSTTTTVYSYTSPVIGSVGSVPVRVTVTDSRNRSTIFETSVTFKEAQKISIDSFKAIRNGTTGIKITANGQYMSQIDGTPKFTITKSIRGANTWSSVATGNVTVSSGRYSIAVTQTSGFTATSAYDLRLVVSGTSTSATGNSVVGTEAVPISFGKHGSGIGAMFDNSNSASLQVGSGGIDSDGRLNVKGSGKTFNLNVTSGSTHLNTTSSNGFIMNDDLFVSGNAYAEDSAGSYKRLARVDELPDVSNIPNPILEAGAWADYGRAVVDNVNTGGADVLTKYGRATVSGSEFTVTFNSYGGSFTGTPIVIATAVSGRWEFVVPSVTTVTATGFTASSVNGANGQAVSTSHEINYIAIGRRA